MAEVIVAQNTACRRHIGMKICFSCLHHPSHKILIHTSGPSSTWIWVINAHRPILILSPAEMGNQTKVSLWQGSHPCSGWQSAWETVTRLRAAWKMKFDSRTHYNLREHGVTHIFVVGSATVIQSVFGERPTDVIVSSKYPGTLAEVHRIDYTAMEYIQKSYIFRIRR